MIARRQLLPGFRHRRWATAALVVLVVSAAVIAGDHSRGHVIAPSPQEHDVSSWAPPASRPLSDARAAALVTLRPESRPGNAAANDYVPTAAQLAAFHVAQRTAGDANRDFNPLTGYVSGRPGIAHPSTDDLIQWVSHKWGIPTDWIRAQLVVESNWNQGQRGDLAALGAAAYRRYPGSSRVAGTHSVYESLGISQEKWLPDGSVGAGTEPLRWKSTAFNLDYYAATIRYYYDGDCSWCSAGYRTAQAWDSIGAWFSPQPWRNPGARAYVRKIQNALAQGIWTQPGF